MPTFVMRNGKIVEKYGPEDIQEERGYAPSVISDYLPGQLKHHGTGKHTDSKSDFRKMTRASGLTEYGNDAPKPRKQERLSREDRRNDIGRAIYDLKNGRS